MDTLSSCSPYLPVYLPPYPPQLLPFYFSIILYIFKFPTDFLPHPNTLIHVVYQPCLLPYHFAFYTSYSHPPVTRTHPPPLYINCHCLLRLSTPCLAHPIPLPCLPPLPHFRFFNQFMSTFACISTSFYL